MWGFDEHLFREHCTCIGMCGCPSINPDSDRDRRSSKTLWENISVAKEKSEEQTKPLRWHDCLPLVNEICQAKPGNSISPEFHQALKSLKDSVMEEIYRGSFVEFLRPVVNCLENIDLISRSFLWTQERIDYCQHEITTVNNRLAFYWK